MFNQFIENSESWSILWVKSPAFRDYIIVDVIRTSRKFWELGRAHLLVVVDKLETVKRRQINTGNLKEVALWEKCTLNGGQGLMII